MGIAAVAARYLVLFGEVVACRYGQSYAVLTVVFETAASHSDAAGLVVKGYKKTLRQEAEA